jgi:hypothetical protein
LKAQDDRGGDYWWLTCPPANTAWQVPHYARARRGDGSLTGRDGQLGLAATDLPAS